jgi:hypothetical protein
LRPWSHRAGGIGRTPRVAGSAKWVWTSIVAVVALITSASSLVFTFLPELKPDPRDSVLAQLHVFAVDPNVTLGDYLQEAYGGDKKAPAPVRVPRQDLRFRGDVVFVRTLVDGFKHRHVALVAKLYWARSQEQIHLPTTKTGIGSLADRTVDLDTPSTSTVQLFWILSLSGENPTFVRVLMYDGTRLLAVGDSPVIRHNRAPLPQS